MSETHNAAFASNRADRVARYDRSNCPNGPDEYGNWPCDPQVVFGGHVAECSVCGRIADWKPKHVHKATLRIAGYARRKGVLGDIHRLDGGRVSGVTHNGRPFSWKRGPNVELIEFGSFNPDNDNYQPGGRPYGTGH